MKPLQLTKQQSKLINVARSWIGTPWMHNQCKKGVGVDCVNFVWAVGKELNIDCATLPTRYSRISVYNQIADFLDLHFRRIGINEIEPSDIILMKLKGLNTHIGFVTDKGIIHASVGQGKVVEHSLDGFWIRKIVCGWRVING